MATHPITWSNAVAHLACGHTTPVVAAGIQYELDTHGESFARCWMDECGWQQVTKLVTP